MELTHIWSTDSEENTKELFITQFVFALVMSGVSKWIKNIINIKD